jgi:serine/threonine protein kinase
MLQSQRLWPVDPNFEQDWSGRGQHTEFTKNERRLVDDILEVQEQLGLTKHALVQSVKCRRILLARKTIFCTRKFTKEQAVQEVAHITPLGHAHVVRIIGTYVLGKELSILLYPVAQYDLRDYLDIIINASEAEAKWYTMVYATRRFFSCLVSAVHHIHARLTKHMDIKPQNILIQKRLKMHSLRKEYPFDFSVCIADFGISRSYDRVEAIETDGRTAFTPKYAAPEVAEQELRGLKADIFSLGCVFLEVYSVLHDADFKWQVHEAVPLSRSAYQSLRAMRGSNGAQLLATQKMQAVLASNLKHDTSYQANLLTLFEAQHKIWHRDPVSAVRYIIVRMMSIDPAQRPSAANLRSTFVESSCCIQGPPELVAMTAALEGSDAEGNEDSQEESDHL